jgi:hypothetical protein
MAGKIDRVVYPELFWNTVEQLRSHVRYPAIRQNLIEFLAFKMDGIQKMGPRDKPFNSKAPLAGIWHWECSRNPHVILFYTYSAGTLTMAMLGDHHDYAFQGQRSTADERTARRIANAIEGGHVPSPMWKSLAWKRPSDITNHPDLFDLSKETVESIRQVLYRELEDGAIFERVFGVSIYENGTQAFESWIDETETAIFALNNALRHTPTTPEQVIALALERRDAIGLSP